MAVNYGTNRVRFPAPVPSGGRIRGRFRVLDVEATVRGQRATIEATVECDGVDKPVCVAELVVLYSVLTASSSSFGQVCYLGAPVGLKRLLLLVVLALVGSVLLVPGATAGNFDEQRMGCTGEDPGICPDGHDRSAVRDSDRAARRRGRGSAP